MVVGDEKANVSIDVDGETIARVNSLKYLGAIKTSTGSCSEDIKARIGRAKKAAIELDAIWKERGIRKALKMKLVKALIWPVITYGAEGWTLNKDDERRLEAAEMWCYRRLLRISWTEKRTNKKTRAYWMNFKRDANSLPKLSKEKWLSLDMHAETISVI